MKIPVLFFLFATISFSQSDWERWSAKNPDFRLSPKYDNTYLYDSSSTGMEILTTIRNGYAFFISDLDGDNCPFYPSCSRFFVLSVKKTNLLQGILMFADRFTRDSNIIKSKNRYKLHRTGKYFDPVELYTLDRYFTRKAYFEYHSHD